MASTRTSRRASTTKVRHISREHVDALTEGRLQRNAIFKYLDALTSKKKPRRRSVGEVKARIAEVEGLLAQPDNLDHIERVGLRQERIDLLTELAELRAHPEPDLEELERGFIAAVGPFSERKGWTYSAWRDEGVPAEVLRKAGIRRTRKVSAAA